MKTINSIETKISQLSPGLMEELERYLDYLINRRVARKSKKLKQNWAGGLKNIKLTAIELQKKSLDWRQGKNS
ncbi:MAG: DUF2281 domain-containing protein [Chlorobi bacterium]|nr:DUF2281 domain-containing protein [Chlorobiota bacterium]